MTSIRFLRSISRIQRPEEAQRVLRLDRYWRSEVLEALLTRIDELVRLKPRNALGLAEVAIELARRIRDCSAGLSAHAHCSLATAQLENGEIEQAATSFARAEPFAAASAPPIQAMVARQKAILLLRQGRECDALKLAQQASAIERRHELSPNKSLAVEALILFFRHELDRSAQCWRAILDTEPPSSQLYLFSLQNFVATQARKDLLAREVVEARYLLDQVQERIKGLRDTPVRAVVWWARAQLHFVMAEFPEALRYLEQAKICFLRLRQITDYALVSIDLAATLVKQGATEKGRGVLQEASDLLLAVEKTGALREAFASVQGWSVELALPKLRAKIYADVSSSSAATLPDTLLKKNA